MTTISSGPETITPEIAAELLERNKVNRPLRTSVVRSYAKDMAAGRWNLNGEPIIIDWFGNLLSGQHRCWAIIEADRPIQTMVTRGVDPASFGTIDSGLKRTAGDVLGMRGVKNAHMVGSSLRLVNFVLSGAIDFDRVAKMSNAEASDLFNTYPDIEDAAAMVSGATMIRRIIPPSPLTAAIYFARKASPEKAEQFLHDLNSGENLVRGMPCYTLRNTFLARASRATVKNYTQLALIIKAWNAYYRDRPLALLKYMPGEEFPMPLGVALNGRDA